MPKSLEAGTITQIDASERRPAVLLELGLSSTLRFVTAKSNVTFPTAGNVYTAKAMDVAGFQQTAEGAVTSITVKFDNTAKDMAAYANSNDFEGKSLVIKRIFLDDVGAANLHVELFRGTMDRPSNIDYNWLTVKAKTGKSLLNRAITRKYQKLCIWNFGGTECNTDSLADLTSLTASGTADSGTTTTLTDSALSQSDDYWNYGAIEITQDSIIYRRIITDYDSSIDTVWFDDALPAAVSNADTYTIYKGCDKTWNTCSADNAWGPSADNSANFGGCLHIADVKDISVFNWLFGIDSIFQ